MGDEKNYGEIIIGLTAKEGLKQKVLNMLVLLEVKILPLGPTKPWPSCDAFLSMKNKKFSFNSKRLVKNHSPTVSFQLWILPS